MNDKNSNNDGGASAGVTGYADPRHRRAQNEVERAIHEERGTTGQNVEGIVISPDLYDALDWNHVHSDTPYLGLWGYPFEVDETMTGIRAVAYSDPAEWMAAAGAA